MADIGIGITGSFGNVDTSNSDSVAGVIYYEIYDYHKSNPIKLVFFHTNQSRKEMKQKTVDIVLSTLEAMLTKMDGENNK